jgi:hypothetical protein
MKANNEKKYFSLSSIMTFFSLGIKKILENPANAITALLYLQGLIANAQMPSNKSLVASYNFNGNVLDQSGNENDGVMYGIDFVNDKFNNSMSAANFDGKTYIKIKADKFPIAERTISLWFKTTIFNLTADRDRGGILLGYGGETCGTSFLLDINNCIGAPANSYEIQAHCDVDQVVYVDNSMYGSVPEWTHLAITTQRNESQIYLNGLLVKSEFNLYMNNTVVSGRDFGIGTGTNPNTGKTPFFNAGAPNFNGTIDNLYVYRIALNNTEIYALYEKDNDPANYITSVEKDVDPTTESILTGIATVLAPTIATLLMFSIYKKVNNSFKRQRAFEKNSIEAIPNIGNGSSCKIEFEKKAAGVIPEVDRRSSLQFK